MTDTQHQNLETVRAEIMARVFDQLYRAMETPAEDESARVTAPAPAEQTE